MSALAALVMLLIGYVAVLAVTLVLSQPIRIELSRLADEMLEEDQWGREERSFMKWLVSSSSSTVVGLFLPFAALSTLALAVLGVAPRANLAREKWNNDPRSDRLVSLYMLSIMACSPFAAMVALPIIAAGVMVRALAGDRHLLRAAEAPIMNASSAFRTC